MLRNEVKPHTFTFLYRSRVYEHGTHSERHKDPLLPYFHVPQILGWPVAYLQSPVGLHRKEKDFKNKIYHVYCTECLNGKRQVDKCDIDFKKSDSEGEGN